MRAAGSGAPDGCTPYHGRVQVCRPLAAVATDDAADGATAHQRTQQGRLAADCWGSACVRKLAQEGEDADSLSLTAFNLDYYTEVQDLDRLVPLLEADPRTRKFSSLNRIICDIIEDFGLVSFETLCVEVRLSFSLLSLTP